MNTLKYPLLSPREAAATLSLSTSTLRSWRERNEGPEYLRVGRSIRYESDAIERWLDALNPNRTVADGG